MKTATFILSFIFLPILAHSQSPELRVVNSGFDLLILEQRNNYENTLLGVDAGMQLNPLTASGFGNTMIGYFSGRDNTGIHNTFIGSSAGSDNISGSSNTYVGMQAGDRSLSGDRNVAIGALAGIFNTGNRNTLIGSGSGSFGSGSGNVYIGDEVGKFHNGSNQLFIHNALTTPDESLMYGEFDNRFLRINGKQEINSYTPDTAALRVLKQSTVPTDIPALQGLNSNNDYYGIGVQGTGGWQGVNGVCTGSSGGFYFGVRGLSNGTGPGTNYGVYGEAILGGTNYSIFGKSLGGQESYAGYFEGKVAIGVNPLDTLAFRIDNSSGDYLVNVLANGETRIKEELIVESGIQIDDIDVGNDDDDIINKTTALRYYISNAGLFPTDSGSNSGTLIGEVKLFPYDFVPGGWIVCEGQLLNIQDYQSLFSLLGTRYGGDGQTTFGIPDMRNAIPNHN